MKNTTSKHKLNRTGARVSSPSSGVRPGARALNLEPPTSFVIRPFVGVLGLLFGGLLLSHSAYAASYLNVSSGGAVSLGSIRPTSSGTSSTGSDTLTVHTDCSAGYSVYVSGQNGKDTDLTNSSAESNNTISTSSNAIGSAGSLSSNTWGLNSENTGTYVGLPTYANATNKALTTKTSVSESSTVPIYYGIKVDTSITPGTYTGDVLYTVLPNSACTTYTVRFNANGGSGTMNNQTINVGSSTALSANTFTKSGYAFLGWSKDKNASIATYGDKEAVKDIADFNTTVDLYAIWAPISGNMQDWTGCPSLVASQQIYLQDARDNKVYSVKKLPDGKCWMTQNLTIGMNAIETGLTLTSADTNIDNGTTYYLPPAGKQGSITSSATLTSTTAANFVNDSITDQNAKTQFRTKGSGYSTTAKGYANDSDTGYYNFYTATLGYSYYNDGKTSGSSTRDICPKGWRLPWTSDSGTTRQGRAEFYALALTYNSDSSVWNNYIAPTSTGTSGPSSKNDDVWTSMSTGAATSGNNYAGFPYAGYWSVTSTSASYLGGFGRYWSSSVFRTNESYGLGLDLSAVVPQDYVNKYLGAAVRCVAQDNYTVNYSADGAESGSPSKTSEGTVYESGSVTMPTVGSMVKSGYEFKGWALTSGASEAAYAAEETVALSALLTAASAAGQTTTVGSTITLYPVWEQAIAGNMQNWTGCSALAAGSTVTLVDTRDNSEYRIKKFTDNGACWMIDNLVLGYDKGYALTSADTNVSDSNTYYIPKAGYQGTGIITEDSRDSTTAATWTNNSARDKHAKVQYKAAGSAGEQSSVSGYTLTQDTGYYNFYTATLGFSYYDDGVSSSSSPRDICPKGWQLPVGNNNNNMSWKALDIELNGSSAGNNRTDATARNVFLNTADFSYLGYYHNSSLYGVGNNGSWWSSTVFNTYYGQYLILYSDGRIHPQANNSDKYYGLAVRCVTKENTYTLSYSNVDFATSNKPSTQTYTGYGTSYTFTIPSAKPTYSTTGTTLTFSNYTYNGKTYNPGDTITLPSSSPSATLTANWTRSCTISSSTGCKLADNKTWIYGNSGNTVTWNNLCTASDNCKASTYCPSGYQNIPTKTVITSLKDAYGNNGALYQILGFASDERFFWSSTQNGSSNATTLLVSSSSAATYYGAKTNSHYVLCYKSS